MIARILIALALTACAAHAQSAPRTPYSPPVKTTLASTREVIPLAKIGRFYYVDVRMNGQPFRLTLETGAGFFSISARAAKALGLRVDSMAVMPSSRSAVAWLDSLTIHGARFEGLSARVNAAWDATDFDGVLSVPVMHDVLATMHLAESRLIFERDTLPSVNGRDVLAIVGKDRGRRIDFPLVLGDVTVPAVLDTRSHFAFMLPDSLLSLLSLRESPKPAGNAYGPSMGTFTLAGAYLTSDACIGTLGIQRPAVLLRNRPGVVVGVPLMEQFVITIDQRKGRIRFARPRGEGIAIIPEQDWEKALATSQTESDIGRATPRQPDAAPAPSRRPMGFNLASINGTELVVVNIVPGSNADKAGIKDRDVLVEFDNTPAAAMSPIVFRSAIAKNTPIKVVVNREGNRFEFLILPQPEL